MKENNPTAGEWLSYRNLTILFMLIKAALHLLTNTHYELHRDEMLYFNMADHLDTGYVSVPPLTAWVAFLVQSIFGYSVFGIRLIPALLGSMTILFISLIIKELKGGRLALIMASVAFIFSPGFLILNTLFTPNVFEQFLWTWIIYLFLKMMQTRNLKIWVGIGILSGASFMFKYSVVFLLAGFFTAILMDHRRKRFISGWFFAALATGLILIFPNIMWQYQHNWPVVLHMVELKNTQLGNMTLPHFLQDLFSLTLVSTLLWLAGLGVLCFHRQEKENRYLGIAMIIFIFIITVMRGKAYYLMGIVPFLLAVGAYAFEKYFNAKKTMVGILFSGVVIATSLTLFPYSLPLLSFDQLKKYDAWLGSPSFIPFARWEDGKIHPVSQVYADMTGWEELTKLTAEAYNQLTETEKKNCIIYAERNYGYAGAIHFYGKKYRLPEPVTFHESYIFWAPDTIKAEALIYIHYNISGMDALFGECSEIGVVSDPFFREKGVKVFICRQPYPNLRSIYHKKAASEKKTLRKKED